MTMQEAMMNEHPPVRTDADELVQGIEKGDVRALARSISLLENESPRALAILSALYRYVGRAYRIGITGPPGAGKSTLLNKLVMEIRKEHHAVGILAVDPSSPFTGGALLGDRIRMNDSVQDGHVYMRSMATRGSLGGLARTTAQAADLLDAFGKDYVVVETVGVGQIELDVASAVDTTIVVLVPESGGSIQAMKAGIMEIADILVINKADRPGAGELEDEILQILEMKPRDERPTPVLLVSAREGKGIEALWAAIKHHREMLAAEGIRELRRKSQIRSAITNHVLERTRSFIERNEEMGRMVESLSLEVLENRCDPFRAASLILKKLGIS
jgi:LAO/AO transport system kinase